MSKQLGVISVYQACAGPLESNKSDSVTDHKENTVWTMGRETDIDTIIYDALSSGKKKASIMGMKKSCSWPCCKKQ